MNIITFITSILISFIYLGRNSFNYIDNEYFLSELSNNNKVFIYNDNYCLLNNTNLLIFNNYICTTNIQAKTNTINFNDFHINNFENLKDDSYFSYIKNFIFYYYFINIFLYFITFIIFNKNNNNSSNNNITELLQNTNLFNNGSDIEVNSSKKPNLTIQNFIGCNNIKKDITKVINQIKYNNIYNNNDCVLPRGLLLIGPPGCGKTHLVNTIINSTGINYIFTSGSDFNKIYVGSGTQTINKIFKKAKENKPCLIFIDEADSIIKKRSHGEFSSSSSEFNSTVCKLLSEMDSLKSESGIILVFATNMNEDYIDKAMLRSGRIDQIINISQPTFEERIDLFKLYLKDLINDNIDLNKISKLSYGLTGADIKKIINSIKINKIYDILQNIIKNYDDEDNYYDKKDVKSNEDDSNEEDNMDEENNIDEEAEKDKKEESIVESSCSDYKRYFNKIKTEEDENYNYNNDEDNENLKGIEKEKINNCDICCKDKSFEEYYVFKRGKQEMYSCVKCWEKRETQLLNQSSWNWSHHTFPGPPYFTVNKDEKED